MVDCQIFRITARLNYSFRVGFFGFGLIFGLWFCCFETKSYYAALVLSLKPRLVWNSYSALASGTGITGLSHHTWLSHVFAFRQGLIYLTWTSKLLLCSWEFLILLPPLAKDCNYRSELSHVVYMVLKTEPWFSALLENQPPTELHTQLPKLLSFCLQPNTLQWSAFNILLLLLCSRQW